MEKEYDQAIDIWSTGCIVAEISKCSLRDERDQNRLKRFMFPGDFCHPLSQNLFMLPQELDQLELILKHGRKKGTEDYNFITKKESLIHVERIEERIEKER